MRVAFVGASPLTVIAAEMMCKRGHEVIVIDRDREKIESLSETLDCGLVSGDGSRPAVLEEIGPEQTDFLFAISDSDEVNILAALVGRSLGFTRVVPRVEEPDLEHICTELGLDDVIVPDREVAIQLVDLVEGRDSPELTTVVRSGLRFFGLKVPPDVGSGAELELPSGVRIVALSRDQDSMLADESTELREGDELVVIAEEGEIDGLSDRFAKPEARDESPDDGSSD